MCVLFCSSIKIEFALATYASVGFPDLTFSAAVDLIIFGKNLYLSLAFDLKDPVGSIKLGADRSTSWYKDKMNKENPTDTSENYYDNPNPFVDFQLSGKLKLQIEFEFFVLSWHLKYEVFSM